MARPNKQGVDYFPLDVHLDDKFKFIEIKYKLEGFAILIKLMQKIYSCGYWYKWTDDEALLFSDEIRTEYELVQNVVNECLSRNVFDGILYEKYSILTSKGIQKRYKEIIRRRKDVEVIEEYLLIDNNFGVNDVINPSELRHNDDKSTQSKVKESKVKENKNIYAEFVSLTEKEFNSLVEKFGESPTRKMIDVLDNYKGANGKKYKSDYRAILNWVAEKVIKESGLGKVFTFDTKTKEKIELQKRLQYLSEQMDLNVYNDEKFIPLEEEFDRIKEELKKFG